MPVYKDGNNGTFYVQCYYRDARGSKRHKTKRGFSSGRSVGEPVQEP